MKNKITIATFALAIIVCGIYLAKKETAPAVPLKIGVILPITGKAAAVGEPSKKLLAIAQEELASKYPNKVIELIVEDGAGDSKTR
jgi:ABC-type branched-subunit amino acid transport system substrate-binding protein